MAEALHLEQKGPYWQDPETFQALAHIADVVRLALRLGDAGFKFLSANGINISPEAQLGKAYARVLAPLLSQIPVPGTDRAPKHSDSIVAIDREGNIAAMTHTINTVIWGGTGIVVSGIPLPGADGFQQFELASIKPGERGSQDSH